MNSHTQLDNAKRDGISTKEGLLWDNNGIIELPRADAIARKYGYSYAEQLVRDLEKYQENC